MNAQNNEHLVKTTLKTHKICVLIPVYNSGMLIKPILLSLLDLGIKILVVNDGSTDETTAILEEFKSNIHIISYPKNKGKGFALKKGFSAAINLGFDYVITMDADGQHSVDDLAKFMLAIEENSQSLLLGIRNLNHKNMPNSSRFANKFSNFWFMIQTCKKISDTQTGYRLYPLHKIKPIHLFCNGYALELELLVKSAWRNINIIQVPINVYYPPKEERVSHFNPTRDFLKISLLNTYLCFIAIVYGYPSMVLRKVLPIEN